jgi:hypothetical protein
VRGASRPGAARHGEEAARSGVVWLGSALHGWARPGKAGHGEAWLGEEKARQG